jgi:hypothetical protein
MARKGCRYALLRLVCDAQDPCYYFSASTLFEKIGQRHWHEPMAIRIKLGLPENRMRVIGANAMVVVRTP